MYLNRISMVDEQSVYEEWSDILAKFAALEACYLHFDFYSVEEKTDEIFGSRKAV